ncbi:mitochondrial import receptor subunit TOM40 homolog 1-like [Aricia agestis]|uniref:mitochondrial import receptor subunit TOM40 homolog 1-like n=1 Tax=Aricia agestis TaxID=91739 RepID=UPI001C2063B0|nr:mitochondrial import receptor subunit TOM40 homolog 1-like [Aricia agestis]
MNSNNDNSVPSMNDLIMFFQVKPVFAKPKICSRECSPPKEESCSSIHADRARSTAGGSRGNRPTVTVRSNEQIGTARDSEQAGNARGSGEPRRTRGSENIERARVKVCSPRGNENFARSKESENADRGRRAKNDSIGTANGKAGNAGAFQNVGSSKVSQLVDRAGGGDVSSPRESVSQPIKANSNNKTVSNRGKAGAGVTGSRKGQMIEENIKLKNQDDKLTEQSTKPGLLRHIHNAARYRVPQCFEGAVVSVKQSATDSNWVIGHSMSFSSVSPGGYKVLLSYAQKHRSDAPYFVLEAAPGGQMSGEVRVSPTQRTRASVVAQIADKQLYSFESIFDVYFKSSTASILAVNREFIALHYLKSITERLSLGAELVARGRDRSLSSASAAARWSDDDNSLSATVGDRGLDVCYARNIKPYLTVASMLEIGFGIQRAVATLAYEWHARDWTVRGSVDSDGLVGATLHRGLGGRRAQLACAISALLNHPNDKFKLGFGITATID